MALTPKFFIDTNISSAVSDGLTRQGLDVLRCEAVGLGNAPDFDLLAYAEAHQRTIITHDAGFRWHNSDWLMAGRHHYGIMICATQFQGAEYSGNIIREVMLYYEVITIGGGSVEDDLMDRIHDIN